MEANWLTLKIRSPQSFFFFLCTVYIRRRARQTNQIHVTQVEHVEKIKEKCVQYTDV